MEKTVPFDAGSGGTRNARQRRPLPLLLAAALHLVLAVPLALQTLLFAWWTQDIVRFTDRYTDMLVLGGFFALAAALTALHISLAIAVARTRRFAFVVQVILGIAEVVGMIVFRRWLESIPSYPEPVFVLLLLPIGAVAILPLWVSIPAFLAPGALALPYWRRIA